MGILSIRSNSIFLDLRVFTVGFTSIFIRRSVNLFLALGPTPGDGPPSRPDLDPTPLTVFRLPSLSPRNTLFALSLGADVGVGGWGVFVVGTMNFGFFSVCATGAFVRRFLCGTIFGAVDAADEISRGWCVWVDFFFSSIWIPALPKTPGVAIRAPPTTAVLATIGVGGTVFTVAIGTELETVVGAMGACIVLGVDEPVVVVGTGISF